MIATYGYDNNSRVTSITYGTGASCSSPPSNLGNLTYTYDSDRRRTATAGSLAAVTLPPNVMGGTSTAYNADNAQTKFNGTALSYDANGNLASDGTNTYTWDARNHLTAISREYGELRLRRVRTAGEKGHRRHDHAVPLRWIEPGARVSTVDIIPP